MTTSIQTIGHMLGNGLRKRRLRAGWAVKGDAKAKGVKFGRKPILNPNQQHEVRKRLGAGETQRSIANSYNVS